MGVRTTPLHLELIAPASPEGRLLIPKDSICGNVEILELLKADTATLGNDRIEVKQDIVLQSFDSGVYRFNPIRYVLGNDTFSSNRLVLKVYPAVVDFETIHDYADVADIDRSFIDYLPDFVVDYGLWILAIIIVLGGGFYAYYLLKRKKNPFAGPAAKPVPPYEKAGRRAQPPAVGEALRKRTRKGILHQAHRYSPCVSPRTFRHQCDGDDFDADTPDAQLKRGGQTFKREYGACARNGGFRQIRKSASPPRRQMSRPSPPPCSSSRTRNQNLSSRKSPKVKKAAITIKRLQQPQNNNKRQCYWQIPDIFGCFCFSYR